MRNLAFLVSPHGFGHAARASAVMEACARLDPNLVFHIFTAVPDWFFRDSLRCSFELHPARLDLGLVQRDSLYVDLDKTVAGLSALYPCRPDAVAALSERVAALGCRAIICDIAPIGIAAARHAGLPSILVENFSWDWIYEGFLDLEPRLDSFIDYLRKLRAGADLCIQTAPACSPAPSAFQTPPVGRRSRTPRPVTRERLAVPPDVPLVLVTMGGLSMQFEFLDALHAQPRYTFIVLGEFPQVESSGNVIKLPQRSTFYHPDLMQAADLVVSKLGYSTTAEAFYCGLPYLYVDRPFFRQAAILKQFLHEHHCAAELTELEFRAGNWERKLSNLIGSPARPRPPAMSGAGAAAERILQFLSDSACNVQRAS